MKYKRKTTKKWKSQAFIGIALLLGVILGAKWNKVINGHTYIHTLEVKEIEVETIVYKNKCETEKCEILSYIVEKFQDDSADAITIVRKCENSTFDQTRTNHNSNGSIDYGIFQINSVHTTRFGDAFKTDWKANVDAAYQIFSERGWEAWSCADVIGYVPFWMK